MSADHHVPSSGVPRRATIMDTPTGTALGSTRRDETADANDIVRAVKFTIRNLPCPAAGPGPRTLTFAHRVGKRAQSTSFHPLCIIYNFLDLINNTPSKPCLQHSSQRLTQPFAPYALSLRLCANGCFPQRRKEKT